jgi:flavin reductase (DIM6/NTAB) family NADH-FMN oxidoreductase RutF
MTANSFTSVSLRPLLILICVAHQAQLLPLIQKQKRFGVSILREDQRALSEYFAQTVEDPEIERRLGIHYRWTETGIPLLQDTLAHLACKVVSEHPAGDHTIFIGEVESLDVHEGKPLLYLCGNYRTLCS